jgi:hypothetical protein
MQRCALRAAARQQGLIRYYNGRPCKHGHLDERYVGTGQCVVCAREATHRFGRTERGRVYRKAWRAQPQIRARDNLAALRAGRQYRYGLTWEQFNAMLVACDNKCQGCDTVFVERSQRHGACVDHDHRTGQIRGLLCHRCNRSVGMLKDDPALLRRLADYLERSRG